MRQGHVIAYFFFYRSYAEPQASIDAAAAAEPGSHGVSLRSRAGDRQVDINPFAPGIYRLRGFFCPEQNRENLVYRGSAVSSANLQSKCLCLKINVIVYSLQGLGPIAENKSANNVY